MNCLSQICDATDARALTVSLNVWTLADGSTPLVDTDYVAVEYMDDSFIIGTACAQCGERILKDDHLRVITEYLVAVTDGVEA